MYLLLHICTFSTPYKAGQGFERILINFVAGKSDTLSKVLINKGLRSFWCQLRLLLYYAFCWENEWCLAPNISLQLNATVKETGGTDETINAFYLGITARVYCCL